MLIVRILKKGNKDVTIQFENDAFLILTVEVFLKSGLKKGDEISEDRFSLLIEQNKLFHIKQRAFRLLGRRTHSSSELRRKLWNKDYEQKLIDEVIEDLKKNNYLDDTAFIRAFVAEKSNAKNWSSKKVKTELLKRGIDNKLIDEMFKGKERNSDIENATKLAMKKYDQLLNKNLETKDLRNKLFAFLFSKGFEYDLIRDVCSKLVQRNTDED
jgi:regulatory protein